MAILVIMVTLVITVIIVILVIMVIMTIMLSTQCPETSLRIHSDCYDKLEKLLVQAAAGNARCRNWSENQVNKCSLTTRTWAVYEF